MATPGWTASREIIASSTAQRPHCNFDEAGVPAYELPDPLLTQGGERVAFPLQWPERRVALLELFREHVYGRRPGVPERLTFDTLMCDPAAMDGAATMKLVAIRSEQAGRRHVYHLSLFVPNRRRGPAPLFLLINNRGIQHTDPLRRHRSAFWPAEEVIARGYAVAAIENSELAPDDRERWRDGVIRLFEGDAPRQPDGCGALAAWGWGASRVMDYVEQDAALDAKRVAVLGHSRGGKAALWAGAEDERFAMVISNDSGCGGAALSRRRFGETVRVITTHFPHWFCSNFERFAEREHELPIDQHELIALIAPRAVYVASADEDLWADPRGEFLSLAHASPVYGLWGHAAIGADTMPGLDAPLVVGPRGYHIRTGKHDLTPTDWGWYMDLADGLGWHESHRP